MRKTLIIILTLFVFPLLAQSEKKLVRSGNSEYDEGNYSEAEVQYRKALDENPNYFKGKFNLGGTMYQQENYEESAKLFNDLAEANLSDQQKAGVWYNLGNNLMKGEKWAEAVEAFKQSLRLKPDDYDAKYNLEYARKKMKDQQDQQQQQNQDQNKDQDQQDEQNKDQNKDQQDKQDQEQQDKQDQQQNQDKQEDSDQQKDQQQQQQPQEISKQDAQRMLDALKNDEKKTLQKLQKEKAKQVKSKKTEIDW